MAKIELKGRESQVHFRMRRTKKGCNILPNWRMAFIGSSHECLSWESMLFGTEGGERNPPTVLRKKKQGRRIVEE